MQKEEPTKLQVRINTILTVVVLSLFIIVPPIMCGLFYLSQVPDVTLGNPDNARFVRVWMHRERRPVGLGFQIRQVAERYSDDEICARTSLRFLLWGESEAVERSTQTKVMTLANGRWQPTGEECR